MIGGMVLKLDMTCLQSGRLRSVRRLCKVSQQPGPAMLLNISPAKCSGLPMPAVA